MRRYNLISARQYIFLPTLKWNRARAFFFTIFKQKNILLLSWFLFWKTKNSFESQFR